MRLTTKGRFAVTAMLDLALNQKECPVSLADISARQGISQSYLEQLFGKLRRAGLVRSLRGASGGYVLNRLAEETSVMDIILAVDDNLDATQCQGKADCSHDTPCMTHNLWQNLNTLISDYLSSVSLGQLVNEQNLTLKKSTKKSAGKKHLASNLQIKADL